MQVRDTWCKQVSDVRSKQVTMDKFDAAAADSPSELNRKTAKVTAGLRTAACTEQYGVFGLQTQGNHRAHQR